MIDCDDLLKHIPQNIDKICVAISGGADSLCLTLLLQEVSLKYKTIELDACFVDHKLREESSKEIIPIIDILRQHGVKHNVLVWQHERIDGNIQSKARYNRYKLLTNYCVNHGIKCLATGHHIMDQWETFFMRLSRGSGISGLSCIQTVSNKDGLLLLRPLLGYTRKEIEETLFVRYGIGSKDFVHDPSNLNEKYERVAWRNRYNALSQYGLTCDSIAMSIKRIQRANNYIDKVSSNVFRRIFFSRLNLLCLNDFLVQDEEVMARVIIMILRSLGCDGNFSYSMIESTCNKICDNKFKSTNICGFLFIRTGNFVVVRREIRKRRP